MNLRLLLCLVLLTVACPALAQRDSARVYLDQVLDLLEQHYVRRESIPWPELRETAYALAAHARKPADTYLAINQVLAHLGDGHMYLWPAAQAGGVVTLYGGGLSLNYGSNAVVYLEPGGPAERAGLRIGDVIETVDGQPLALSSELLSVRIGEIRKLEVYRTVSDQRFRVSLRLDVRVRARPPVGRILGRFAYLELPGFGRQDADSFDYAQEVQSLIRRLDKHSPCGWIVDLRNNTGGLFYSMLLGVGPLLGDGVVGGKTAPNFRGDWILESGRIRLSSGSSDQVMEEISQPHRLRKTNPPVAVLLGSQTTSAGEAVAIALRGRSNVRFFGEPSFGYTTALRLFRLPDGAILAVATAFFTDRNGQAYDQQVEPDEYIPTEWGHFQSELDAPLKRAKTWLEQHPFCSQHQGSVL
jgi:C-terminal processing protease CtpA/Prc